MVTGDDVFIDEFARIKRPHLVEIGSHVAIDFGFYCTTALQIGDYIHIAPYVTVIGGADGLFRMGHFATIAAGSRIIVRGDEHKGAGLVSPVIPDEYRDNVIGDVTFMDDFSSLGTNVILYANVWLAQGVVVAAGSVVTKPIEEPWTIWGGTPARKIGTRYSQNMIAYARELGYDF